MRFKIEVKFIMNHSSRPYNDRNDRVLTVDVLWNLYRVLSWYSALRVSLTRGIDHYKGKKYRFYQPIR